MFITLGCAPYLDQVYYLCAWAGGSGVLRVLTCALWLQLEALNLRGGPAAPLSTMPDVALATGTLTLPRRRSLRQPRDSQRQPDLGDGARHYQSH